MIKSKTPFKIVSDTAKKIGYSIAKPIKKVGNYIAKQNAIDHESREYSSKKLQKENEDEMIGKYTPSKSIKKGRMTSDGYMPR